MSTSFFLPEILLQSKNVNVLFIDFGNKDTHIVRLGFLSPYFVIVFKLRHIFLILSKYVFIIYSPFLDNEGIQRIVNNTLKTNCPNEISTIQAKQKPKKGTYNLIKRS